ncbi:hypothetical protein L1885_27830, partial [Streptomyces fuscigenes]|nr:hypothetical protein [Streptomyces fuscigenes]
MRFSSSRHPAATAASPAAAAAFPKEVAPYAPPQGAAPYAVTATGAHTQPKAAHRWAERGVRPVSAGEGRCARAPPPGAAVPGP